MKVRQGAPYGPFRNVIVRWPKERLTVVVLTNRNAPEPYPLALKIAALYRSRTE